jgi:hypothetical protein
MVRLWLIDFLAHLIQFLQGVRQSLQRHADERAGQSAKWHPPGHSTLRWPRRNRVLGQLDHWAQMRQNA